MEFSLIHKRRRKLPHWTTGSAIYSVTFRLADSLPQEVIAMWKAELHDIETMQQTGTRQLSSDEEQRLRKLQQPKAEELLNNGDGSCWLRNDSIAPIVADALKYFDGTRYQLFAWCIMPNHVHVILQPLGQHALRDILHSWKSFTAHQANIILKRKGPFWREESYDHLIRDEAELWHAMEYVWNNPESAGMKEWKWRWKIAKWDQ